MSLYNWIFIFSVALQMAAAIMLLLGTISIKQITAIIKRENRSNVLYGNIENADEKIAERNSEDEENNIEKFMQMHMNRWAAGYLFAGYLLGIWAENGEKYRVLETIFSVCLFIILCSIAIIRSKICGKRDNKKINVKSDNHITNIG